MKTDYTEITVRLMNEFTAKHLQENAELIQATIEATEKALAISRVSKSVCVQTGLECGFPCHSECPLYEELKLR